MKHIRQICSEVYTVVNTEKGEDLENHPSILNNPDLFEIVENDIPKNAQYLNYSE